MKNEWCFEGMVYKCQHIQKKAGGYFTTFSLMVSQGKNKETNEWNPSGWVNVKVFGELGGSLPIIPDKTKALVAGYHRWNNDEKYKGWEYHATSVQLEETEKAPF
jgi:hypothetical protein